MMNIDKKHLKKSIKNIWHHIMADGRSKEEYRLYWNPETKEMEVHSYIGSNWSPGNQELICTYTISQNVDVEAWFDLPRLIDEDGNNLGVWWEDNPEGKPYTEQDFFTEIFIGYIRDAFLTGIDSTKKNIPEFSDEDYHQLSEALDEILSELEEELNLDAEKPMLAD